MFYFLEVWRGRGLELLTDIGKRLGRVITWELTSLGSRNTDFGLAGACEWLPYGVWSRAHICRVIKFSPVGCTSIRIAGMLSVMS